MNSLSQFENMTIADLRKLHEDFSKCQNIIKKQEETIQKLKIKYPNKKLDEDNFDMNKFIAECE